jgi:hypothetical protein
MFDRNSIKVHFSLPSSQDYCFMFDRNVLHTEWPCISKGKIPTLSTEGLADKNKITKLNGSKVHIQVQQEY